MPFTRVWTKNNPPGGQAANTADDEIRNLREDIEERVATLVTGWTTVAPTDPVVVKPEILGNVVGKRIFLHHSAFTAEHLQLSTYEFTRAANHEYTQHALADPNSRFLQAAVVIPVGVTITEFAALVDRNGASNMFAELDYVEFDVTPVAFGTGSAVVTAVNGISLLSAAIAHVVATDRLYFVVVSFPASQAARLYGVRITYTTPDCRNTL